MKEDKKYFVARFFDDMYEGKEGSGLSKTEADKLCNECNSRPRHYVHYGVREELK